MLNLNAEVEQQMEEIVDTIINTGELDNNADPEEVFKVFWDETFNSHGEWWNFSKCDLTLRNFEELLENYQDLLRGGLADTEPDLSVDNLLRQYGYWTARTLEEHYIDLLKEKYEEKSNEDA